MPREQIPAACQRCRKKRTKCDGQNPCQRCDNVSEDCDYTHNRWESKSELRSEIERLKKINEDQGQLLKTFASSKNVDAFQTLLKSVVDGNKPHKDHLKAADEDVDSESVSPSNAVSTPETVDSSCFAQLHSWRLCRPSISEGKLSGISEESTILSLPPFPLDAYATQSHTDTWTRTGWTRAHIRHLFDTVLTWDYMPFSLLRKDLFLRDYQNDSTQFCSSALVYAILALASRLINEHDDDFGLLPSGWFGSKLFLDEAEELLQQNGALDSLPNIQALGILSFYQIRCGREERAHELAEACVTSIKKLCQRQPPADKAADQYYRARATTHCGAVSLVRMLRLTTGLLFNVPIHILQDDPLILDESTYSSTGENQESCQTRPYLSTVAYNSEQCEMHLITGKISQLTEWVHNFIVMARSAPQIASNDVVAVYTKCLDWYESLFALVSHDGSRTPFMLFVHMYYHFCVLCALRPFVGIVQHESDIQPEKICAQAAQSILALAQSHDDLFTLRRVSGLIPYFICASGLYGLGMTDSGAPMDPVHLRLRDFHGPMTKSEPAMSKVVDDQCDTSAHQLHIKISVAAHARLLLAKIGSSHPAAAMAERMLSRKV